MQIDMVSWSCNPNLRTYIWPISIFPSKTTQFQD
jgi:hypothetical protein